MKLLLITICLLISNITLAGDQVDCTHQTANFTYSDFEKRLDRINREYNSSGSSSLAASFSAATHPGNFPFLTRNSKLYSVPSVGDPALSTLKICHWSTMEQDKKSTQIDAYNLAFLNQSKDHSLELT